MKTRVTSREAAYDERLVSIFKTEAPDEVAAFELIERWGLVAAMPDGEDSSGRAKLRLPTPDELVARAFAIAETAWATAHAKGRIVTIPDLNEINADLDEERAKKKAGRAA